LGEELCGVMSWREAPAKTAGVRGALCNRRRALFGDVGVLPACIKSLANDLI